MLASPPHCHGLGTQGAAWLETRLCHGWDSAPHRPTPCIGVQWIALGLGLQSQPARWVCACLKGHLPPGRFMGDGSGLGSAPHTHQR